LLVGCVAISFTESTADITVGTHQVDYPESLPIFLISCETINGEFTIEIGIKETYHLLGKELALIVQPFQGMGHITKDLVDVGKTGQLGESGKAFTKPDIYVF
jgi:hypothetical protein